jgi:hypothetical protein
LRKEKLVRLLLPRWRAAARGFLATIPHLSASRVRLRRNLLVDAETLLDFGYAREKVVNFFCEPGIARAQLF